MCVFTKVNFFQIRNKNSHQHVFSLNKKFVEATVVYVLDHVCSWLLDVSEVQQVKRLKQQVCHVCSRAGGHVL